MKVIDCSFLSPLNEAGYCLRAIDRVSMVTVVKLHPQKSPKDLFNVRKYLSTGADYSGTSI